MKLADKLWNKHGENLDEKSLTICSGTDYINVNYQHIICPDAATAKVCSEIYSKMPFPFTDVIVDGPRRRDYLIFEWGRFSARLIVWGECV